MSRKAKLIAGIIIAVAIAVIGIVVSVSVTANLEGKQQVIVKNAADLENAFSEKTDKTVVLAKDISVDGDLTLGVLNNFDLNGYSLTIKGNLTIKDASASGNYIVGKVDKDSDGGKITAKNIKLDTPKAHVEWSADVAFDEGGFDVSTSQKTFVFSGKVFGTDGKAASEADIKLTGGSVTISSAAENITYNVNIAEGVSESRVENATTADGAIVNIVTSEDVTVAGKVNVNSLGGSVTVTTEAKADVSISGSVASVSGANDSKVTINDGATVSGDVTAGSVVNNGTVTGNVDAGDYEQGENGSVGGEVSCREDTTITASDVTATYNGSAVAVTYTTNNKEGAATVTYYKDGKKLSSAPVDAGKYTAVIEIAASENYNAAEKTVNITINKATPSVKAPSAKTLTYTGSAQELVTAGSTNGGKLVYSLEQNGTYGETIPTATNAGSYTVYYKVNGDNNYNDVAVKSVTVTIAKATPSVTAPTAKTLTYTGSAQALVNAGSTTGGTLVYSLSENGTYSATVPTGTNAGSYTVYYKVNGDNNYNDVAAQSVSVTIAKATPSVTAPTAKTLTYTGSAQALVTAGSTTGGTLVYSLEQNGAYSETIPTGTNAGSYTVYYKVNGDNNYNDVAVKSVTVTIAKATPSVTAPTAKTLTYTGSAQALVNAGSTTGGTLVYSLSENGTYSATVPTGTNAGSYTVYYKVNGDNNYNDVAAQSVSVTIAKATPSVTAPTAKTPTYTGSAQALVTAGSTTGGTLVYSLEQNGAYSETIPTGTNAGSYTVYYKVNGDNNYNDVSAKSVTVTIAKAKVAKPVIDDNSFEYNGKEQGIAIAESDAYTVSGTTSATAVGEYSATVTLNANYTWSDGSETVETYSWSITAGTAVVTTEEELKAALADDGYSTIKLGADIAITAIYSDTDESLIPSVFIDRDVNIDLNGKTISVAYNGENVYVNTIGIFCVDGANVIINGNGGTITAEAGNNNSYGINIIKGGSVTVNGGNYYGAITAIQVTNGTLTVNDGFFDLAPTCKAAVPEYAKYVINCIDASFNNGTAKIVVKGGTFVNFDPSSKPEGNDTTYVAEGSKVAAKTVGDEIHYTVYAEDADMSSVDYDVIVYSEKITEGVYLGYKNAEVATAAGLSLLENYKDQKLYAKFVSDITYTDIAGLNRIVQQAGGSLILDLNERTFALSCVVNNTVFVKNGFEFVIKNGTLVANNATYANACFSAETQSIITFEDLNVTSTGSVLYPRGDAAEVNIVNCDIVTTGVYVVGTNAATVENYNISININSSTLRTDAADGDACAVMINVAGTLNVSESDIFGQRQGVVVRAGTANFNNVDIVADLKYTNGISRDTDPAKWGSGNEVAYGALVVGNNTASTYTANAVVTFTGGSLTCTTSVDVLKAHTNALYAVRLNSETYTTSVTLDGTLIDGKVINYDGTASVEGLSGNETVAAYAADETEIKELLAGDCDEIILISDMEVSSELTIAEGRTVTLDLNGKAITVPAAVDGRSIYAVSNYGELTLKDSFGEGKISSRGVQNYGKMYLLGGRIESIDSNGGGAAVWNEGYFEMTGGTLAFTGTNSGNNTGLAFNNVTANAEGKILAGNIVSPTSAIFATLGKVTIGSVDSELIIDNIQLANQTKYFNCIKVYGGATAEIVNVSFESHYGGGIEVAGGDVVLRDCDFTQTEYYDWNSMMIAVSNGGNVDIYDCTGVSENYGFYVFNSGGTINIHSGKYSAEKTLVKVDGSTYGSVINIYGGEYSGTFAISGSNAELNVYGGTFDNDPSAYVESGYKTVKNDDGENVSYTVVEDNESAGN